MDFPNIEEGQLKHASAEECRGILAAILPAYKEALDLCEAQAEQLTEKASTVEQLEEKIRLQKVASEQATAWEEVAVKVASMLSDFQLLQPQYKEALVEKLASDPASITNVLSRVLHHTQPAPSEGVGYNVKGTTKSSTSEKIVPEDDPFYAVIRNGA